MIVAVSYFVMGLLILLYGGHLLVTYSSKLALRLGIPSLIIGLTVVAYGTSSPELATNIASTIQNKNDLALGNIIGSNILNVLFILGISALIKPIKTNNKIIKFDLIVMIVVSLVLWALSFRPFHRIEGFFLLLGLVIYTFLTYYFAKKKVSALNNEAKGPQGKNIVIVILLILVALALLTAGAYSMVKGAIFIARYLGISELVIGLTIVAAGTSLPELITSIYAGIKNEDDISTGNVVGSNIFNILGVLGITFLISSKPIISSKEAVYFDLPVMVIAAFVCIPIFISKSAIQRWEGALFIFFYISYIVYLILKGLNHPFLDNYTHLIFYYLLPLAFLLILFNFILYFKKK